MKPGLLLVSGVAVMSVVISAFGQEGTHPFDTGADPSKSLIDLRTLNEKEAGQSGFVHLAPSGDGFVLGDGTPVRFWAVNTNISKFDDEQLARHARWLARYGVNMVRLSGATLQSKKPGSQLTDVADESLKYAWRIVAALKKEGIYTTIHPYWGAGSGADATNWGIDGYIGKTGLWGLLFFNKELQRGYKAWLKELLTRPNPYTGIALAKDPAVAIFILQNEDSLLFWTSQGIKPPQKAVLAAQFVEWLKVKYGTLEAAQKAWDGDTLKGDSPAEGVLALYDIYHATIPQTGGKGKRIRDQYQFFVETMRKFNVEMAKYLKEELGCGQLICPGNWRTANESLMLDAERWSYAADDIIAKNHYFNGFHQGPAAGYAVRKGDWIADRSVLYSPRMLPVNMKQVAGHPNVITESTWTNPDLYQAEAPFLVAAYGALTGLSGFYWFATGGAPEFEPPMGKFPVAQPMLAGLFPAAALIYRKGYVRPAEAVVHEERTSDDLWNRKLSLICEDAAYDPNRDPNRSGQEESVMQTDPLAFLVGRVEVRLDGDSAKTKAMDLSRFLDTQHKIIRSVTGELEWNYGTGVCTLNAPKAQGACGFLKQAGPIKLADVEITCENPYASVLVVPLDDAPLKQSRRVLVQIGTTARPTGWKTEAAATRPKGEKEDVAGEKILAVGKAPWRIADTHLTMRLNNPALVKAKLLDGSGAAQREVPLQKDAGAVTVTAPPETMYLMIDD